MSTRKISKNAMALALATSVIGCGSFASIAHASTPSSKIASFTSDDIGAGNYLLRQGDSFQATHACETLNCTVAIPDGFTLPSSLKLEDKTKAGATKKVYTLSGTAPAPGAYYLELNIKEGSVNYNHKVNLFVLDKINEKNLTVGKFTGTVKNGPGNIYNYTVYAGDNIPSDGRSYSYTTEAELDDVEPRALEGENLPTGAILTSGSGSSTYLGTTTLYNKVGVIGKANKVGTFKVKEYFEYPENTWNEHDHNYTVIANPLDEATTPTPSTTTTPVDTTKPVIGVLNNVVDLPLNKRINPIHVTVSDDSAITVKVEGLPPGVSYNPTTSNIEGSPTQNGTYNILVTATDAAGNYSTEGFTMVTGNGVNPTPTPTTTESTTPTPTQSSTPTASETTTPTPTQSSTPTASETAGDGPVINGIEEDAVIDLAKDVEMDAITLKAPEGTQITVEGLPEGVTYDNGSISGTPTVEGTYEVTIKATYEGKTTTKSFKMVVKENSDASPTPTATSTGTSTSTATKNPTLVTNGSSSNSRTVARTTSSPSTAARLSTVRNNSSDNSNNAKASNNSKSNNGKTVTKDAAKTVDSGDNQSSQNFLMVLLGSLGMLGAGLIGFGAKNRSKN